MRSLYVFTDPRLAEYNFGEGHPFGPDRMGAFLASLRGFLNDPAAAMEESRLATQEELEFFHTPSYVEFVKSASEEGEGYLDYGDTPAFQGIYESAARIVGTTLLGVEMIQGGSCRRVFTPIAGMHHGRRDRASGFCVFNDCCVAIEVLRRVHKLRRIAYVDIDAHHGDGVYYGYHEDPDVSIVDFHEDGRYLYPGTGASWEIGSGDAAGTKLNFPLKPGATDEDFFELWERAEEFIAAARPEFVLLQCGTDSLRGDALAHLHFTSAVHAHVARRLSLLADTHCEGKLLVMGGGGYNLENLAAGWSAVIDALKAGEQEDR